MIIQLLTFSAFWPFLSMEKMSEQRALFLSFSSGQFAMCLSLLTSALSKHLLLNHRAGQTAEKQILPSSAAIIWPARPQFLEVSLSALLKVCKQFILIIDVNFHIEVIENKSLHAFIKKLI